MMMSCSRNNIDDDDDEEDTYSTSLYARRNSLMVANPTVPCIAPTPTTQCDRQRCRHHRRRHSMSTAEERQSVTAKQRMQVLFHIRGTAEARTTRESITTKQQQQKKRQPASQYTYYQEPAECDNRRNPIQSMFHNIRRRVRHSNSARQTAKNELCVSAALARGMLDFQ